MRDSQSFSAATSAPKLKPAIKKIVWHGVIRRRAIILIAIATVILLVLAALVTAWVLRERAIEDWKMELSNLTLVLAENTAQTMTTANLASINILQKIKNSQVSNDKAFKQYLGGKKMLEDLLEIKKTLPHLETISILDANGDRLLTTRGIESKIVNLRGRDFYQYHRNNKASGFYISNQLIGKTSEEYLFTLTRRVENNEGQFLGIVVVGISSDFMSDFYKSVSLGQYASISLIHENLTLLSRWPKVEDMLGKKMAGHVAQFIAEGKTADVLLSTGPRQASKGEEINRLGALRKVPDYPLLINVTITDKLYLRSWRRAVDYIGGIALLTLLILLSVFGMMLMLLSRLEHDAQLAQLLQKQADVANEAKTRFLTTMSHEIRTPINGVLGMTALMQETALDAEQRAYAKYISEAGWELVRIIDEILDFSRVESGKMVLEETDFDLVKLMQEIIQFKSPKAKLKKLELLLNVNGVASAWVRADKGRLRQVLINLMQNALKFTAKGSVSLSMRVTPDVQQPDILHLHCSVADTGIGMDQGQQTNLFQAFSQADNTIRRRFGGTGLGLAISKRMIEMMQGKINCVSYPDHGSLFFFEVPCRKIETPPQVATTMPLTSAVPAMQLSSHHRRQNIRVLIAEDTEMNRNLLMMMLKKQGYAVTTVKNGQEAIDILARQQFDVILMDCMMPVLDGYEATKQIRRIEAASRNARTSIIALTASAIQGDRERCLAAGMDDYVSKPFTMPFLIETIGRWVDLGLEQTQDLKDPAIKEVKLE